VLLKMAAESPFEGERDNALAAAGRLAARYDMTLEEAAAGNRAPAHPRADTVARSWAAERETADMAHAFHTTEADVVADKARREAALRDAMARGLDAEERRRAPRRPGARSNPSRRSGDSFARVLLSETSLPFTEIASLTGLDIYQVVGLKLKLRAAT
jgi:Protein of unknown function (DUF2786)